MRLPRTHFNTRFLGENFRFRSEKAVTEDHSALRSERLRRSGYKRGVTVDTSSLLRRSNAVMLMLGIIEEISAVPIMFKLGCEGRASGTAFASRKLEVAAENGVLK